MMEIDGNGIDEQLMELQECLAPEELERMLLGPQVAAVQLRNADVEPVVARRGLPAVGTVLHYARMTQSRGPALSAVKRHRERLPLVSYLRTGGRTPETDRTYTVILHEHNLVIVRGEGYDRSSPKYLMMTDREDHAVFVPPGTRLRVTMIVKGGVRSRGQDWP
ncbi:unnamed protein product [Bursaphelenchus xylophilus]|uniref:(pine wood nematode) hypothetical protein n=1 Tax=Bursaphelenchus xylophilus TaxID=6326 RepID=A0A1I7RTX8_BURXY|nr:unnamed protein product [Bursaphelenchus xylophilus]CAG9132117.1 unnamed protein product [Bursaphelenchus xylophilus]